VRARRTQGCGRAQPAWPNPSPPPPALSHQGDLIHWARLLDAFDAFFEQQATGRADVRLQDAAPEQPFPSAACLAVLGATATIFEHCSSNKQVYASFEVRSWWISASFLPTVCRVI
jgi:hypothetical protein